MGKKQWLYADAPSQTVGLMICTCCQKRIESGPFRYRETEDAYLPQHKACSLSDPKWAEIDAAYAGSDLRERRRLEAYARFVHEFGEPDDLIGSELVSVVATPAPVPLGGGEAKRGTDAQILFERKLTCEAIEGALAFGYEGSNPPPEPTHWLAQFWELGRYKASLEDRVEELEAAHQAQDAAPVPAGVQGDAARWRWLNDSGLDSNGNHIVMARMKDGALLCEVADYNVCADAAIAQSTKGA